MLKQETIKDKAQVLALVLRKGDFPEGLSFYTREKDFVQVATWHYQKGKVLLSHLHKKAKRVAWRTQEVVYVKKGKMRADIYSEKEKLIKKTILKEGDLMVAFGGGHGYTILENGTEIIELKNGPYLGLEKDKKLIEN